MRGIMCSFHMAAPRESAGEFCGQSSPGRALGHEVTAGCGWTVGTAPHPALPPASLTCLWDTGTLLLVKAQPPPQGHTPGRLPHHTWELLAPVCPLQTPPVLWSTPVISDVLSKLSPSPDQQQALVLDAKTLQVPHQAGFRAES